MGQCSSADQSGPHPQPLSRVTPAPGLAGEAHRRLFSGWPQLLARPATWCVTGTSLPRCGPLATCMGSISRSLCRLYMCLLGCSFPSAFRTVCLHLILTGREHSGFGCFCVPLCVSVRMLFSLLFLCLKRLWAWGLSEENSINHDGF